MIIAVLLSEIRARNWESTSISARTSRASGPTPLTFWDCDGITFEPADNTVWVNGELELRGLRLRRSSPDQLAVTPATPALRWTKDAAIIGPAIASVYDDCEKRGEYIPNINDTPAAVLSWLHAQGYDATLTRIKEIADEAPYAARRGRPGVRHRK